MSSIITDTIDCPQCGLPSQKDECYVTGQERVICNWCGYHHFKSIEGTESSKGFGSIHYVPKEVNGSNQLENIVRLKNPMDIISRHRTIMDIQEKYDIDKSSFYVWDDDKEELECLIGKKPQTIEEAYEEKRREAEYYREIEFASRLTKEVEGF